MGFSSAAREKGVLFLKRLRDHSCVSRLFLLLAVLTVALMPGCGGKATPTPTPEITTLNLRALLGSSDLSVGNNRLGFALLGPTNVELSRMRWIAQRLVAVPLGLLMVATIMRVGQGRGLEFIYFQF